MTRDSNLCGTRTEMRRKDYAFQRQFNEKPSIIPGCPGVWTTQMEIDSGCKSPPALLEVQTAA